MLILNYLISIIYFIDVYFGFNLQLLGTYRQSLTRKMYIHGILFLDMMLGNSIAEDLSAIASGDKSSAEDDIWTSDKEECITQLVRHSQLTLLPPDEECLGGWALVDPFSL